jgi:hypothetical protein
MKGTLLEGLPSGAATLLGVDDGGPGEGGGAGGTGDESAATQLAHGEPPHPPGARPAIPEVGQDGGERIL